MPSSVKPIAGGGGGGEGLRSLESLDALELGRLLARTGFTDYRDAFVAKNVTGELLQCVESVDDLKELGVVMPVAKFKVLRKRINEVSYLFLVAHNRIATHAAVVARALRLTLHSTATLLNLINLGWVSSVDSLSAYTIKRPRRGLAIYSMHV